MYIAPNTDIYILKNIPLGKDYENTVYYKDKNAQSAAFMKYMKYHLTDYSYQRAQLGTLRVELKYENLYDCNYLMFKNTNFENKWFYCFITGIAYINNDVTEIYYEMDVMQTWCYDYQFLDSFVERRHARHDRAYTNTQPEGLELGSVYHTGEYNVIFPTNVCILVATEPLRSQGTGAVVVGLTTDIIFTGLNVYAGSTTAIHNLYGNAKGDGKTSAIILIYMAPALESTSYHYPYQVETKDFNYTKKDLDSYIPKNYKLYNSPYRFLRATNNLGVDIDYKPEYFTGKSGTDITVKFALSTIKYPSGAMRLTPLNYFLNANTIENSIVYANYPTGGWASDVFSTWWAQNKNNYIATLNAIGRSYDTNQQIAQNAFQIANRSAQASSAMTRNSAAAELANATASANTALAVQQNSYDTGTFTRAASAGAGVLGGLLNLQFGDAAAAGLNAANSQLTSLTDLTNQRMQTATAVGNASNTAGTAVQNAGIALSTALKNNATSLESQQLSGLTAKQNAVEALEAKKQDIENIPPAAKGNAQGESMNFYTGHCGFTITMITLKSEYAMNIDKYFTVYGYAQRKMYNAGNLNSRINRPHYTFTKTVGANIRGNCNASDLATIRGIYDNGITTWDNLEDVGNYALNNEGDHQNGEE